MSEQDSSQAEKRPLQELLTEAVREEVKPPTGTWLHPLGLGLSDLDRIVGLVLQKIGELGYSVTRVEDQTLEEAEAVEGEEKPK